MARNGREAYDLINLHRPALAMLDLYMPEMNGDECCRQLKNNSELCNIPIIMVTTAGNEDDMFNAERLDAMISSSSRSIGGLLSRRSRNFSRWMNGWKKTPVRMQVIYGNKELHTGFLVNLSSGELFLETNSPLCPEESLSLEFHSPNQRQPICCRGSVA